jgi:hypothetical protein
MLSYSALLATDLSIIKWHATDEISQASSFKITPSIDKTSSSVKLILLKHSAKRYDLPENGKKYASICS